MATKVEQFEESTKIHSSNEIDEILRKTKSAPSLREDDYDNFEEHTIIGPAQELATKSMEEPDPTPEPPVVSPRASTKNVVRRTGPVMIPRASTPPPNVRAAGSQAENPAPTDDDAFAPWDEFEKEAKATEPAPLPPAAEEPAYEAPAIEVAPVVEEEPIVEHARVVEAPAPIVAAVPKKSMRWGVVAWVVLLVATISAGSLAYVKITNLERELAAAKAQLEKR